MDATIQEQINKAKPDPKPAVVTPIEPLATVPLQIQANPLKEYVAGGLNNLIGAYYQSLPPHIDDVTGDFGADLYERMMFDPKVAGAVNLLKLAILNQGVKLLNPIKDEKDPKHKQAQDILDFCVENLNNLKSGFVRVLWQLLDSMALGYKVAEQIYELGQGEQVGKLVLKDIKVKPRTSTAFVVDAYMNVVGLLALLPGQGFGSFLTQGLIGVPQTSADSGSVGTPINLFPREKFVISTWNGKDSDPRGTSILRPAYNSWWIKTQLWGEYLKFMTQYGTPVMIGTTPENAQSWPLTDNLGNPTDPNAPIITPEQAMLTTMLNNRNGTAMVFPAGSTVELMQSTGNGAAFTENFKLLNSEITVGILYQSLATGEADHQTGAATGSHADVLDMVINWGKQHAEELIENDILYWLVAYNFGQVAADTLLPEVSLSDGDQADFALNATAIGTLMSTGYLDESQLPDTDARLGLPVRDQDAINQRKQQEAQQAMQMMQQQGVQNDGEPGTSQHNTGMVAKQPGLSKAGIGKTATQGSGSGAGNGKAAAGKQGQ